MNYRKYITILFFFAITIAINAQTWVAIDTAYNIAQKPAIEVLVSNVTQYKYRLTIYGYNKTTITENNTPYEQIEIADWYTLNNVGEPSLPVFTQFVGLPANNECTISISEEEWVTKPIGKIYPAQEPRAENDTTEYIFAINDSLYNLSEYQTERYILGDKACIGGMYGIPLSVIPMKYYPTQGKIDVLKSCVVTVNFVQSSEVDVNISIKNRKLLNGIVANYNDDLLNTYNIPTADSISNNTYDYLIITADKYKNADALKEFCAWKKIKGHNCKIVSCSEIGGNNPDSIKACIKEWYEKGVEYVLFVGNKHDVAYYLYKNEVDECIPSDYWYVCVDGINDNVEIPSSTPLPTPNIKDFYADLAFGRFPIMDVNDLETMLRKTMDYENYTPNDTWITKNLLIAHEEKAPGKYQQCCEDIRTTEYVKMPHFTTAYGAHDSLGGNNATNDMVVSYINEGYGIVNYRGHGVITGWRDDWNYQEREFNYNYVKKLSNTKYPVVFSVACNVGCIFVDTISYMEEPEPPGLGSLNIIYYSKSLLYNFLASRHGAAAFIGASDYTDPRINDVYNLYLYKLLYNENTNYSLGNLNVAAQISTLQYISNSYIQDAMSYICGGDPSLEIWTDTITKFPQIDVTYDNGILRVDARTIENYTLTLFSQSDSSYFRKYNVEGTTITVTDVPTSFVLSLNKHNFMPLVYNVSDGDIYIQNENYALVRNLSGRNVYIGSDVTPLKPEGNVTIKSGAIFKVEAKGKTLINNNFKVEQGAKMIIR